MDHLIYRTKSGKVLTEAEIRRLARDAQNSFFSSSAYRTGQEMNRVRERLIHRMLGTNKAGLAIITKLPLKRGK